MSIEPQFRKRSIVVLCLFLSIPFGFKEIPHRFKVPPPLLHIAFNEEWESPPISEEENLKIKEILHLPFIYLNHGNQSYVFESNDGKYVIKMFRYRMIRFPFLQSIKDMFDRLCAKKAKDHFIVKINKTFKAARIAFAEAQAYTQVMYCHLNLSNDQLPVTHFKKGARSYSIPMDRVRFVIQRKVMPFKQAMLDARNDPQKMRSQIDSLISLLMARSSQGIRNSDPTLGPNFGFYKGQAVEMDFGNYRKISLDPEKQWAEIDQLISRLEVWLRKNAPEYVSLISDQRLSVKRTINQRKGISL